MADKLTSGVSAKQLKESISKWDAADGCTASLSHAQKDCVLELSSAIAQRPISSLVILYLVAVKWKRFFSLDCGCGYFFFLVYNCCCHLHFLPSYFKTLLCVLEY